MLTWISLGITSVPFLAFCAAAALLTYFFSRKKVTSHVMKATRGARYWSLVQNVLSLFRVTGTYKGFGLWWGRSDQVRQWMESWGWWHNKKITDQTSTTQVSKSLRFFSCFFFMWPQVRLRILVNNYIFQNKTRKREEKIIKLVFVQIISYINYKCMYRL